MFPSKNVLTVTFLAGALVMDVIKTRQANRVYRAAGDCIVALQSDVDAYQEALDLRTQQVDYLLNILNRTDDLELTEFDAIALNDLNLIQK